MTKITEYYLNKASYIAVDENGEKIDIEVNYWQGGFSLSRDNPELAEYAKKLLKNKHRVNFIHKLKQK